MKERILTTCLAILIPLTAGVSYIHTTFATQHNVVTLKERVLDQTEKLNDSIQRIETLICRMAIRQELENAEELCTE